MIDVSPQPRVIVLEDDVLVRRAIARVLRAENATPIEVGSVREALAYVASSDPAWIVDYRLPDGDGLGVLEQVRRGGNWAPALVLTGFASLKLAAHAARLGAGFHSKPVDRSAITSLVAQRRRDSIVRPGPRTASSRIARLLGLTEAQAEVIEARVDDGISRAGLAYRFGISEDAVKKRIAKILRKAHAHGFASETLDLFLVDARARD